MEVLKNALMKFGIGKWTAMMKSRVLPTKSIQQCYLQTQRLLGQQSLAGFMGLHVNIDQIRIDNIKKQVEIFFITFRASENVVFWSTSRASLPPKRNLSFLTSIRRGMDSLRSKLQTLGCPQPSISWRSMRSARLPIRSPSSPSSRR